MGTKTKEGQANLCGGNPPTVMHEEPHFNRAWELIILAAFRKWLGGNRAKGLLPEPLAIIG